MRLILWFIHRMGLPIFQKVEGRKSQKAYHDAYYVEELRNVLSQKAAYYIKTVGLRATNQDEVWFYRGAVMAYQEMVRNIDKYHKLLADEKTKKKV